MIKRTTRGFQVLAEPKQRDRAKLLLKIAGFGVFVTLISLLIAAASETAMVAPAAFASATGLLILGALYLRFSTPVVKFGTEARSISGAVDLAYGDAVAVIVSKQSKVFRIELLANGVGEELKGEIESIRRALDDELLSNSTTPEALTRIRDRLARHRAAITKAPRLYVAKSHRELATWRTVEAIAKELDIPVLDDVGRACIEKTPRELDIPIVEQLGKVIAMPPRLTLAPRGVIISDDEDTMTMSWPARNTHVHAAIVLGLVAVCSLLGALGSEGGQRGGLLALAICTAAAAGFFVLASYLMKPMYEVYMDSMLFKYARPSKKPEVMAISALESLEHDSGKETDLNLVSDSELLKLECRREDVAVFVRSAIMYRLGKLVSERQASA